MNNESIKNGFSDDSSFNRGAFGSSSSPSNMVCSRLRLFKGLRTSGFDITEKKSSYLPFRISLNLEKFAPDKKANETDTINQEDTSEYFLLAYAAPITTAYKRNNHFLFRFPLLRFHSRIIEFLFFVCLF